jgi:glycine oxidase
VVVVAAGTGSDPLLAPFTPRRLLRGVKGQALLLRAPAPSFAPIVAGAGLYIVPQPGGQVAVGATSEPDWTEPRATDAALDSLLARARALCPDLDGVTVVARWAGVRPRGLTADPVVGPVPGRPGLFVATGGYKLGFALAHAVARALAAMLDDRPHRLPEGFGTTALGEGAPSGPRRERA